MIFKWETEKESLIRHMRISPREKLEWLREINEFIAKFSSKSAKAIRQELKKIRNI